MLPLTELVPFSDRRPSSSELWMPPPVPAELSRTAVSIRVTLPASFAIPPPRSVALLSRMTESMTVTTFNGWLKSMTVAMPPPYAACPLVTTQAVERDGHASLDREDASGVGAVERGLTESGV